MGNKEDVNNKTNYIISVIGVEKKLSKASKPKKFKVIKPWIGVGKIRSA